MEDRDRYNSDETAPTKVVSPGYVPSSTTFHPETQASQAPEPVSSPYRSVSPQASDSLSEQPYEAHRLRGQVRWLRISLIASVVVLGSALAGVFLGIRQEQTAIRNAQGDLSSQINILEDALPQEDTLPQEDVSAEAPSAIELPTVAMPSEEQLNQLEEQLRTLNEQTKALSEQAKAISEQLPDVSFDQWTQLQERLATLEEDIQNNLPDEALSTRFEQLSERLKQLLNQPQTESAEPAETETAQ